MKTVQNPVSVPDVFAAILAVMQIDPPVPITGRGQLQKCKSRFLLRFRASNNLLD